MARAQAFLHPNQSCVAMPRGNSPPLGLPGLSDSERAGGSSVPHVTSRPSRWPSRARSHPRGTSPGRFKGVLTIGQE